MSGAGLTSEDIEALQDKLSSNRARGIKVEGGKEAATPAPDSEIVSDIREQLKRRRDEDNCQYVTSPVVADRTDYSKQQVAGAMLTLQDEGEVKDRSAGNSRSQWRILF